MASSALQKIPTETPGSPRSSKTGSGIVWPVHRSSSGKSSISNLEKRDIRHKGPSTGYFTSRTARTGQTTISRRFSLAGICTVLISRDFEAFARAEPPAQAERQQRAPAASVAQRAETVLRLSATAHAAADNRDYQQALQAYNDIIANYSDLALAQYAHLGKAFMLYQLGHAADSVSELKALEAKLRGYAEVHAALAVMLYNQHPPALDRAEYQWDIGSEFDARFSDPEWVAQERHWPPAMVAGLQRFLDIS